MFKPLTMMIVALKLFDTSNTAVLAQEVINEKSIDAVIEKATFNGTVLVADKGRIIHSKGYGDAVKEWHIPNVPEAKFQIASISKSFTATLIMMLVEDGKIDLDISLDTYLPSYPAGYANKVTIRHLLTHRSGISRYFKIPGWTSGKSLQTISSDEFLASIAAMPLEFKPGKAQNYSSANYYILGKVIEAVTKQSFGTYLQEKILTPTGMINTGIYQSGKITPMLASGYKPVNGKYSFCPEGTIRYCKASAINFSLFRASGSMYSTTADLLKWDQILYGTSLISSASKAIIFKPDTSFAWDIGHLQISPNKTINVISANGGLEGYSSLLIRLPDDNHTIILLSNAGVSYNDMLNIAVSITEKLYVD